MRSRRRRSAPTPYVEEALGWVPTQPVDTRPAPHRRDTVGSRGPAARILLADDNADMRDYVSRLLGERWHVEAVADGEAALAAARARPPDLIARPT